MKAGNLTGGQKVLGSLAFGLICLLLLEGAARLATRGPRWINRYYVEMSRDYAGLDSLIEDTQKMSGPVYYDEFLYAAGPVSTQHINFTDYYGARLTPSSVPLANADHIVWTFGGSTMENTETTDDLSIANTWARVFNETLGPTHVKNFGAGGFISSFELIKFQKLLREAPESEMPTVAVFYDGFNDSLFAFQYGPGKLQKDVSLKLQALVEQKHFVLWAYSTSSLLSKYSRLWERSGARLVDYWLFPFPQPDTGAANLAGAVRVYSRNVRMIQATCEAFQIHCFFILQPLLVTKQPLTLLEAEALAGLEGHPRFGPEGTRFVREFYERAAQEFADDERFIDASRILDGRSQSDFYDLGHTAAQTAPVIGELTAGLMLDRLRPVSSTSSLLHPGATGLQRGPLEGGVAPANACGFRSACPAR